MPRPVDHREQQIANLFLALGGGGGVDLGDFLDHLGAGPSVSGQSKPVRAAVADANDAEYFGHLSAAERERFETLLRDIVRGHGIARLAADQHG